MERRQFIKSIAAAASSPLLPAGLLKGAQISPSLYANAVNFASGDANFAQNTDLEEAPETNDPAHARTPH